MRFSIITPTLNAAPYIERLIESVEAQSFADWEHVIIDSGSNDGTDEILRRHPHLVVISEPDEGIYDAMNKGIAMARGEWLYFIGADDRLHDPDVLASVDALIQPEDDVIYGDVVSPRFGGRYDGPFDCDKIRKKNICHQSIFFRKRVFETVGLFTVRYSAQADWDHNMRWLLSPKVSSRYIDRVIAEYSDGGYSSVNRDPEYESEHLFKYLEYGRDVVPARIRFRALGREGLTSLQRLDLRRFSVCSYKMLQETMRSLTRRSGRQRK